jgi:tetratricopeptide (TPR) repeat protein
MGARARTWLDQLLGLMERKELPRECQSQGLLVRALCALDAGDATAALGYAEQALQLAEQVDIANNRADACVVVGDARARLKLHLEAAAAYQQAFDWYTKLGNLPMSIKPQAKLAQIALAQGDMAQAHTHVEAILVSLAETSGVGLDEPFEVYLTCYHILEASDDPRAATVLQTALRLLHEYADGITEDALRQSFLENVATHRELLRAGTGVAATVSAAAAF